MAETVALFFCLPAWRNFYDDTGPFASIALFIPFLLPHNPTPKLEVLQEPGQYVIQVCKLATKLVFSI